VLKPTHGTTSVQPVFAGVLLDEAYHAYRIRLAASLNIPSTASDQDIHYIIVAGFSASLIQSLCDVGTIRPEERDRIIPLKMLPTKLVSNQLLTVDESDRLFRFAHITAMADVIFGDAEKAKQWLSKPISRFSGKSPTGVLTTTHGTHRVEQMLIEVNDGMSFRSNRS